MPQTTRYSHVAMLLHWVIAALILFNIALGWRSEELLHDPAQRAAGFQFMQLHKSIGITILLLTLARLGWRFYRPPPPLTVAGWQGMAAKMMHVLFYVLMIGLPLGGLMIGTAKGFPTVWFNLIPIPDIPFIPRGGEAGKELGETLGDVHGTIAWLWLALIGLHVAAALKHHLFDKDDTLARMIPGLKPRSR